MPMSPAAKPTVVTRALTQDECAELLERHHVGRLAFSFHDRVDIQPLHYVFDGGSIYGRTSDGAKLLTLAHNQWVAFEVDEVHGTFDWTSTVAHGSFHRLDPEHPAAKTATDLLRSIVPETFTSADPVANRTILFRIAIDEMTGRAAQWARAIPG